MKPLTKNDNPKNWGLANWINIVVAVLSALVGAVGTQAANAANLV